MATSNCISQSVTKTNNKKEPKEDVLVCIQKSITLKVIQDLERGDESAQKIKLLENIVQYKDSVIYSQDSIIVKQSKSIISCEKNINDFNDIDAINQQTIKNLKRDLNREKRGKKMWRGIAGGFALLAIIVAK